jgi:transposase, IS5 family
VVPFESFRAEIEAATLTPASEKKSNAGRKPIDVIVMFRMLVLVFDGVPVSKAR